MIEVEHLCKRRGAVEAVRDLSFEVSRGEVLGFVGPNGAGKTTTLQILAGFLGPGSGRVCIGGHDIVAERQQAQRCMGYLPERCPLYPEMRVSEYLRFRAELKRIPRRRRSAELGRVLELARAREVERVRIGHLSRGYRQRIGLAEALLGSPALLLLDEPSSGLDPNQIRELRALLRQLGEQHTILLSTHLLSEVEASCDRAIVIAEGLLLAQGTVDELRARRRSPHRLHLEVAGDQATALAIVRQQPRVERAEAVGAPSAGAAELVVDLAPEDPEARDDAAPSSEEGGSTEARAAAAAERIAAALVGAGLGLRRLSPIRASLEQVFAELTAEAEDEQEAP